jgi:hypothetical protein
MTRICTRRGVHVPRSKTEEESWQPNLDRLVDATACHHVHEFPRVGIRPVNTVGGHIVLLARNLSSPRKSRDEVPVCFKRFHASPGLKLPHADSPVIGRGEQVLPGGMEH